MTLPSICHPQQLTVYTDSVSFTPMALFTAIGRVQVPVPSAVCNWSDDVTVKPQFCTADLFVLCNQHQTLVRNLLELPFFNYNIGDKTKPGEEPFIQRRFSRPRLSKHPQKVQASNQKGKKTKKVAKS